MDIKRVIFKKFCRRNLTDPCFNCVMYIYMNVACIIGISTRGKCTHDNRIKSDYSAPIWGIVASILSAVVLLIGSVYELHSSYDSQIRFWDLRNMEVLALFEWKFAQGLVVLCTIKHWRTLKYTMIATQYCFYQLEFIAVKSEILKVLLNVKYLAEIFTVISIFSTVIFSTYHYWILSKISVIMMLNTFALAHIYLGMTLFVTTYHLILKICYEKLRNVLASSANTEDAFRLVSHICSVEIKLKLIIKTRATGYRSVLKLIDFIRLGFYLHSLRNIFSHAEIICVVILKLIYEDFFILKNEYTFFVLLTGIVFLADCSVCHTGEKMAKEVRLYVFPRR